MDIAGELGDYLNDLEEINFTFDEGKTNLNFAEAALLIQGSACIYSKKVEYLHALVFQALDFVADKKRREDAIASGQAVDDDDGDDEASFLALDDCLVEAESSAIDLDEADFFARLGAAADSTLDTSMAAINDETEEYVNASHTSPALANSALLQMIQGKDTGDGSEFKMSGCSVHPSGALVIDAADIDLLDERLTYFDRTTGDDSGAADVSGARFNEANRSPTAPEHQANDTEETAMLPAPMDDDENDFGGGGLMDDDDGAFAQAVTAGPSAPQPATAQQQNGEDQDEDDFDPYAPLDMHDPSALPLRPFKKGRPGGAKALQKRKEAMSVAAAAYAAIGTDNTSSADDVESIVLSLLATAGAGAAANKAEFAYARQSLECTRRALRQKTKGDKKTVTATGDLLGLDASAVAAAAGNGEYDDEGDDDGWAGATGFDDDDSGGFEDFEGPDAEVGLAGLVGSTVVTLAGEAGELTYEELCQAHINEFLAAAAAAEVQSELTTRVQMWKSKMDPSIAEQDAREQFDIHVYGDRVISRLADNVATAKVIGTCEGDDASVEVGFNDVVAGQEKWQVARMFASMLQLINNGNIAVEQQVAAALPDTSGPGSLALPDAVIAGMPSRKDANPSSGKENNPEDEMGEEGYHASGRPTGSAYSTLETGELKLRLLTSTIRELNISAARRKPDEMHELTAPDAVEEDEMEVAVADQVPTDKEKPAAKKHRVRPKKAAAKIIDKAEPIVSKTVNSEEGRTTRASRRTALADNKRR